MTYAKPPAQPYRRRVVYKPSSPRTPVEDSPAPIDLVVRRLFHDGIRVVLRTESTVQAPRHRQLGSSTPSANEEGVGRRRTPRPQSALSHTELTSHEMGVAKLASDGATNGEIGAELFISSSTVACHLRKLGVANRTQLARRLAETLGRNFRPHRWTASPQHPLTPCRWMVRHEPRVDT